MAFRRRFISAEQFEALLARTPNCEYGDYLKRVAAEAKQIKEDLK
jgi:hypothetical protein